MSAVIAFALLGVSSLIRVTFPGGSDSFAGTSADESCDLLTATEIEELSGARLSAPTVRDVGGLPACQWGTLEGVGVQVVRVPAEVWAKQLPTLMQGLQDSVPGTALDTAQLRRRLEAIRGAIESGREIAPDQACDLFEGILDIQGIGGSGWRTIRLLPTKQEPLAISGQACNSGRYTSVVLADPDLTGNQDELTRVAVALMSAHRSRVA